MRGKSLEKRLYCCMILLICKIKLMLKSCLTGSEPDPAKEIDPAGPRTLAQGKALRISVLLRQAQDHFRS